MDLETLLLLDYGLDLDISGGQHISLDNPIVIHQSHRLDYVSVEHLIVKCICEGRRVEWRLLDQRLFEHNGRLIDKLRIETVETTADEYITQIESYYFDIHECFGKAAVEENAIEQAPNGEFKAEEMPQSFFSSVDDYISFQNMRGDMRMIASANGQYFGELTKKGDYFIYRIMTKEGIWMGDYVKCFSATQENINTFNKGCGTVAERFTIYLKTRDMNQVPEEPLPFGSLTYVVEE
jgi:hypothetical protein